tara:strand:- start:1093 stop:1419 length:327 start_codon:yes stop_codon:yes gene_type:complete
LLLKNKIILYDIQSKMGYTAYSAKDIIMKTINVAGGGLSNGNAYAEIQVIYDDKDMCEIKAVFYEEFGNNHYRKYIGNDIEWGEDDDFKVLNNGKYVDEEDEEEEEDE